MNRAGLAISQVVLLVGAIGCSKPAEQQMPGVTVPPGGVVGPGAGVAGGAATPGVSTGRAGAGGAAAVTPGTGPVTPVGGSVANPGTPGDVGVGGAPATGAGGAPAAAGSGGPAVPPPGGDAALDWTMMGYDPGSTYFNTAEKTLTKDNAGSLQVLWTADLGGNVLGGGLQVGDKVFASGPGAVFAFDAATGMQLWKTTASSSSTLGYADGTLYLNATSGNVMAFNAADGAMKWSMKSHATGNDGSSSVLPLGGMVFVGAASGPDELSGGAFRGYMAAHDAATGTPKWATFTVPEGSLGASFWSSPSASMADGLVFGGTGNNYAPPATDTSDSLVAFDFNTGEIKWKYQRVENDTFPGNLTAPDSDFGNNPVLYEAMVGGAMEKVVAGATKYGYIVALKRMSGELIWKRDICKAGSADGNQGLFTNFSYSGKGLVSACNEGGPATLISQDPVTGDIQWMRPLVGRVWGRMAFANGVGFVGTGETVEAFDVDTGAVIKSFPSKGGTVASTITISRGRVVFGEGIAWLPAGLVAGSTLTVLGLK